VVRAPRETVFRAISSLDGLRSWWTPLVSGSAEVGGDIRFAFDGMDEQTFCSPAALTIGVRPRRAHVCFDARPFAPTFEPRG
jgi:uncharacterized protein YndB with AHSA1/START domain